ncbi:putative BOI-related E3 ubiquitin-protein ligase 3 [Bidens hawaiensis]|uniref:putative BOI-related E3 ubiquitin-protein ligase 3 n=1 Tax=Bidens hawaiensis TaxID=980011 RepID=UPI0040497D7D
MILLSMAVEASHREMMYQGDEIRFQTEEDIPVYGSAMTELFPANAFSSRKRSRDSSFSFNPSFCYPNAPVMNPNAFEFLNEDIIGSQIYQQQFEIDRFITNHNEKVKTEMEEIRKQNSMRLITLYEGLLNKLKTKEDEIMKIRLVNHSLEEKVKSMTIENQIWRELAQTNEATANALRNNLQQVLEQAQQQQQRVDMADDAESHCGGGGGGERRCRRCGKEESSVLLLPCRHLCVCRLCVSAISTCPVCNCAKSAGVQVNTT